MSAKGLLRYRCNNAASAARALPQQHLPPGGTAKTLELSICLSNGHNGLPPHHISGWGSNSGAQQTSPTGSLTSEAASSSVGSPLSSGSGNSHILEEEEDNDNSLDEGIEDILASSPSCNLCGHRFCGTADFLDHVRMHFSSGRRDQLSPPPTTTSAPQPDVERGSMTHSPPASSPPAYPVVHPNSSPSSLGSAHSDNRSISSSGGQGSRLTCEKSSGTVNSQQQLPSPTAETRLAPPPQQSPSNTQQQHNDNGLLNSSLDFLLDIDINSSLLQSLQQQQQQQQQQGTAGVSTVQQHVTKAPAAPTPQRSPANTANSSTFPTAPSIYAAGGVPPNANVSLPPPATFPDPFGYLGLGLAGHGPPHQQFPGHHHYQFPTAAYHHAANSLPPAATAFPMLQQQQLLQPPKFCCFMCPATFEVREALLSHMVLHQQQQQQQPQQHVVMPPEGSPLHYFNGHNNTNSNSLLLPNYNNSHHQQQQNARTTNQRMPQQQQQLKRPHHGNSGTLPSSGHAANCSCGCRRQVTGSSSRERKMKKMEEDIDAETLKQISALEWERKHG